MKRMAIITLLCLILASCREDHPIDALVASLNESHGLWINGVYPDIDLPPDATPDEVIAQAIKKHGFDQGHIKTYTIQEIRQVQIGTETYSAALLQSDLGRKILLFRPERHNQLWTRFYEVSR
jgi:hypothetical protein